MLISLTAVIILLLISNHHDVHLKYIHTLFKNKRSEVKMQSDHHTSFIRNAKGNSLGRK